MLELSLNATIPPSRVGQTLSVLAGQCASQPMRIQEQHILFKPKPAPPRPFHVGGTQNITGTSTKAPTQDARDALIIKLIRPTTEDEACMMHTAEEDDEDAELERELLNGTVAVPVTTREDDAHEAEREKTLRTMWTMRVYDLPQPAAKTVTTRTVWSVEKIEGNPEEYLKKLEYSYLNQYLLAGHFLVYQNIVVKLYRLYRLPAPTPNYLDPTSALPAVQELVPVDPSGTHILEASVMIEDGTKPDHVARGNKALEEFRKGFQGVFELLVPDRLAMDTRIRQKY